MLRCIIFDILIVQSNRATLHTTLTVEIIKDRLFAMRLISLVLLLTILYCINATCVSLGGVCYGSSGNGVLKSLIEQNSMQFNINWFGKPNYEDVVFSEFNGNQCDTIRYSFLHQ